MKINREYLCFIFCIALTMSSCPNNCNNHGSCVDNVCNCDEMIGIGGGKDLMYVGADCSSCPMGISFSNLKEVSSVGPQHENGIGTSRLLSNCSSVERVSIRLLSEESGISLVNDMKIEYADKNIGLFGCYDLLNVYVGKLILYGKNVTSNEYYVKPEFEDDISVSEVICKYIQKFDDLSLYFVSTIDKDCNTLQADECILTMKGMKEILDVNEFTFADGDRKYNFLCDGQNTAIEFVESEENDEIVFKNAVAADATLPSGTTCRLLAKLEGKYIKSITDNSDISNCLYCKIPKLENPIGNTNYRKITDSSITLGENEFGIFDVYHKYSGDYLGRSNIYHSADSYIKYDFNITLAGEYIDYKYELVEKSEDISILFSSKVDDECKIEGEEESKKASCTITVNDIKTILGVTLASDGLTFACMNSSGTITEYGRWSVALDGANIKFTIAEGATAVPNANDECHLLAKVSSDDSGYKLSTVDLKNNFYYMKNNENTKIQFKKVDGYTNIYTADIKYTKGTTGSILLCNNGRINQEVILFHEDGVNTIYVSTRNNGILSGSYSCSVSRLLTDYSLINPITVSDECTKDKCELKWEGMPITDLTGVSNVNLACDNQTGLITIYEFTTKVDTPSGRLLTDLKNITLKPTTANDETKIPKSKDICHILLKPGESTAVTLKDSDYGKELGSSCIETSIEINERNKQSKVYEVINYDIIVASSSYIGKLYCQLGNGLIGDAYLMGKSTGSDSTNYYILYDFDYNNNPKPNDYICILIDSYNDLSLFNEVKVLGQGANGGVCYDGKCDIIWKNMNSLLSAVDLGDGITGSKVVNTIKTVLTPPASLYMVCIDRVKNVKLYEYKGAASDPNITFSVDADKPYPKVGDSCSLLSQLDGNAIVSGDKYKSLYNSYYYKKNSEYNYPQLLDYNYTDVDSKATKIYRVKGLKLEDKSFTVGLLKCFKEGEFKGTATVFGIKDDYTYIRYDFLTSAEPVPAAEPVQVAEPVPSEYSYVIVKKYTDLSLLLTGKTTCSGSDDITCTISFSDIKPVIEELYPKIIESETTINFACVSSSTAVYEAKKDSADNKFDFTITITGLTETSNCYMLNNFDGTTITTVESSQYGKSPRLQSSKAVTTINSKEVYSVLNMNGFGKLQCYKKGVSTPVDVINYGISKTEPKVNYISFDAAVSDITDYYECNYTKIYNDYSFYPPIAKTDTVNNKCTAAAGDNPSKCALTWTGMKPIIEGIGLDNKPLQFKCTKGTDDIYIKLTTDVSKSTSKTTRRMLEDNDLLLYLSNEDKDTTVPTDGYDCSLYVYSNGTNINYKELPKIEEIISEVADNIYIYTVSNVDFKDTNGIGYKTCKVNGETETLIFMGKKDKNRYIKFNSEMTKEQYLLIECDDKETTFNDLSLYYNITIPASDCTASACTIAGIYPLLQNVGFFNDKGENSNTYSLACNVEGSDYTKYDGFKFEKGNTNDVKVTGTATITDKSVCHILSKFDGTKIDDETNSDYVKNIQITTSKSFGGRNIYIVKNLKDDLKNKIGELKCVNKESKLPLGTAYLMGYTDKDDNYYIDYSFTSTPTPYAYNCSVVKEYSDLSLLYEIVYDKKPINVKDIFEIYAISSLSGDKNVVCKNSLSSKITVYTATYTSPKLTFTGSTPESQDKCSLLIKTDGAAVDLVKSDYGKFYGINKYDEEDEIVAVKVDTTPVVVKKEEIEIPSTIPSSGNALIKCYDKETNEYLGDGEILGENVNGEVIIKYYFGNADGSSIEPSLLEIVPTVIRNDYSTTRTPKIEDNCTGTECILVWSEMKGVLIGLLSSSSNRMRNLNENCFSSSALDKSGKEISVDICDNGLENNNDVNVEVTDPSEKMSKGDSLYPLVNRLGSISAQSSEAYKLLKTGGDVKFDTTDIEHMNKVKKFLFKDVTFDTRQLYPGNTITMSLTFAVAKTDAQPTPYTITGVEKNYKVTANDPPRLLNENIRILANPTTYAYAVSVSEWKELKEEDQTVNDLQFSAQSGSVSKLIECSGAGRCDRESGECKCYNGFTGSACERMDCPNQCNNHGKCIRISDLMNVIPKYIFGNMAGEEKIFGCKCDSGYRGADCSLKECPSDKDDRDCSNNGLCDYSDGSCKCFDGYYGEACQHSIGTA